MSASRGAWWTCSVASDSGSVFRAVTAYVEDQSRECIQPVFLLDEAQLRLQAPLEHLHVLLNYEWDRRALLSVRCHRHAARSRSRQPARRESIIKRARQYGGVSQSSS